MALICLVWIGLLWAILGCGGGGGGSGPTAPVAAFTVSTAGGTTPLSVDFDASGTTDADGSVVQYAWAFGDGNTGDGPRVSHTYTRAGDYTARLTVTDNDGLMDTASQRIVVEAPAYRISGTVTLAPYAVTDSDVNDINTAPVANDAFDQAQAISAPITVSGYVNVAGAGESGNSTIAGDPDDYYRIALSQGTTITLVMAADPALADLILYLYDERQDPIDASLTSGNTVDSLTVPADGTYYIRVEAVADATVQTATAYALNIGRTGAASPSAAKVLRLSDNFVPGEVLVQFDDQADEATLARLTGGSIGISAMELGAPTNAIGRVRLLRRDTSTQKDTVFEKLGITATIHRSLSPGSMDKTKRSKMETLWMVRALEKQPGVHLAEPNYIRKPLLAPNDPLYSYQWHYPLINLADAWDITTGSADVVVAVVDTGVLVDHPDLAGKLTTGYDFISSPARSLDGDAVDADPDDPGDQNNLDGTSTFHGTHVAGTIAAATNNGTGVAGIAWNTRVMPLRVLGHDGGTTYDIIQAVKYAAGLATAYPGIKLDQAVDVINLSLGGEGYSDIEEAVYQQARDQGVIIIAAAGNKGTSVKMYPAAYDGVVSVSAVTIDEERASYSSYGDTIDVAAPGGSSTDINGDGYADGVLSTLGDDSSAPITMEYGFVMGTSMAAPHISGVVALMKALYPALAPDEFDALLEGGYLTQDLGASGRDDQFGWGRIDAYRAVLIARQGGSTGSIPAILGVDPSTLSFGSSLTNSVVRVQNSGNTAEPLAITDFFADAAWISATPLDVDDDGLGNYTVSVDRQGMAEGTYSGNLTFVSDSNQANVLVSMQVGTSAIGAGGGYHYIRLLDPDTDEIRQQVGSAGEDGRYPYTFSGLSPGERFMIYAGTDPNYNGELCETGEACGAYLSLDQPVIITVESDITDIDFSTDIDLSLSPSGQSAQSPTALLGNRIKERIQ